MYTSWVTNKCGYWSFTIFMGAWGLFGKGAHRFHVTLTYMVSLQTILDCISTMQFQILLMYMVVPQTILDCTSTMQSSKSSLCTWVHGVTETSGLISHICIYLCCPWSLPWCPLKCSNKNLQFPHRVSFTGALALSKTKHQTMLDCYPMQSFKSYSQLWQKTAEYCIQIVNLWEKSNKLFNFLILITFFERTIWPFPLISLKQRNKPKNQTLQYASLQKGTTFVFYLKNYLRL